MNRCSKQGRHGKRRVGTFLRCAAAAALFQVATTPAAFADILGTAGNFGVLAGSTVTNTGTTNIGTGTNPANVGVSPGSAVTGFPPGIVSGTIYGGGAVPGQAQVDLTTAYNALASLAGFDLTGTDLGGLTVNSGVYSFSSSAQLTGNLILDAQGAANAFWVFQTGSTLTTASSSTVSIINGTGSVYWQIGSSATLGTGTAFVGNILADQSITLTTGVTIGCGSALARIGAVTLDTNTIGIGCDALAFDGEGKVIVPTGSGGGSGGEPGGEVPGPGETPVPEPGTLLLVGTGIAGLIARIRLSARG